VDVIRQHDESVDFEGTLVARLATDSRSTSI
jgi:hypothetical protein